LDRIINLRQEGAGPGAKQDRDRIGTRVCHGEVKLAVAVEVRSGDHRMAGARDCVGLRRIE